MIESPNGEQAGNVAMTMTQISQWANQNEGVLALLAVLLVLVPPVYRRFRKTFPCKQEKRLKVQEEFAHAERMKKEVESHAQWDKVLHHYGVFLVRDVERRLPETEEVHSSVTGLLFDKCFDRHPHGASRIHTWSRWRKVHKKRRRSLALC